MRARAFEAQRQTHCPLPSDPVLTKQLRWNAPRTATRPSGTTWFQRYYPNLFRYAYIRLRRRPEAEEIASQVFVEAYRGIARYTYTGKPILAWLYRIAHNLVYDRLKFEERRSVLQVDSPAATDTTDGPESIIANIDLLNAIDTLTDEQQRRRHPALLPWHVRAGSLRSRLARHRPPYSLCKRRPLLALRGRLGEEFRL